MLLSNLDVLATAPGGVARLRELILTLAVQGKLVPQDPADEPASELLKKIRLEKDRLIAAGKIRRDKPLAEIADDDKPFDLPANWEWARLGEITNYGSSVKAGAISPETWVLDMEDIEKSSGRLLQRLRYAERASLSDKNCFAKGDVLYGKLRPYLNKVLVADEDGVCTTEIMPFRCHGDFEPEYFRIALSSPFFLAYVNARSYGMKMPRLGTEDARSALLALPPLPEQSRIVTRVEELMRLCDALEAKGQLEAAQHAQLVSALLGQLTASSTPDELHDNWQRVAQHFDLLLDRPAAVDALEQTILQLAVRGLLVPQDPTDEPASTLLQKIRLEKDRLIAEGKIKRDKPLPPITDEDKPFGLPVGWEWCQLDELVTIRGGKRVSNGYQLLTVQTEFIYIRVSDMKDGSIDGADLRYLDAQMRSAISRYIITKADIYMTIVGATIGKCGLVPERFDGMNLTENAARLTPHVVSKDYLFRLLASEFCQEQFLGKTKQVGVQKMALNRLAGTLIPLPPLAEQSRIVTRVESLRRLCADLRHRLATRQTTQAHLAEALVNEVA